MNGFVFFWGAVALVGAWIAVTSWRTHVKDKAREAYRLGSPEDRTPHAVQMLDGSFAVRRWCEGRWELYGSCYWWPAVGRKEYREYVGFYTSPTEALANYKKRAEEQANEEALVNDVGVKVTSSND